MESGWGLSFTDQLDGHGAMGKCLGGRGVSLQLVLRRGVTIVTINSVRTAANRLNLKSR